MSEIGIQLRSTESRKVCVHTSSLDLLRSVRLSIFLCSINHDAGLYPSLCIYSQSHNSSSIRMYACVVFSAYVHKSAFLPLLICLPLSDQLILSQKANELNCRFDLPSGPRRCACVHNLISPFFSLAYAKRLCISALGESLL